MIERAEVIYERWADGKEFPGLPVPRSQDDGSTVDAFERAHPSLSRCIVEVHQRTASLFPVHQLCRCAIHHGTLSRKSYSEEVAPQPSLLPELWPSSEGGRVWPALPVDVAGPMFDIRTGIGANGLRDNVTMDLSAGQNSWMAWF
jgi:hypothetical protein